LSPARLYFAAKQNKAVQIVLHGQDGATEKEVKSGIESVRIKKKLKLAEQIEFYRMAEGKSIQMLHVGPFSAELISLARIAEFSETNGLEQNGIHHEIYLSDFRKTIPEKLRTILREPVK